MQDRWNKAAKALARKAHEELFAKRIGIQELGRDMIGIFHNNPYANSVWMRSNELFELQERLEQSGYRVAAGAHWPTEGPEAGYTAALVIELPKGNDIDEDYAQVADAVNDGYAKSTERLAKRRHEFPQVEPSRYSGPIAKTHARDGSAGVVSLRNRSEEKGRHR